MAKLYFYYSAMNAGKTTMLLQSNYNYHERGMRTLLFTPKVDDRYRSGVIHSRIGLEAEAMAFDSASDLFKQSVESNAQETLHCILLDEAQFLSKTQVWQLTEIVDRLKIPVLAYGLRSDFQGEPFEGSRYLLTWADYLHEIKTICHCGRKANFVLRLAEDGSVLSSGDQIAIGGNESYLSVCRLHYKTQTTHSPSINANRTELDHVTES